MPETPILFPQPCHEDWDRMSAADRGRFCESCRKPVHDAGQHTPEELETLAARGDACLRASVDAEGRVVTRPSLSGRVLTAAVIAPAVMSAIAASAVAAPSTGSIVGSLQANAPGAVVTAVGHGVRRTATVDSQGAFHLDRLPPGPYRLLFTAPDGAHWSVKRVEVRAGTVSIRHSRHPLASDLPPPPPTMGLPPVPKPGPELPIPPTPLPVGQVALPPAPVPPSPSQPPGAGDA